MLVDPSLLGISRIDLEGSDCSLPIRRFRPCVFEAFPFDEVICCCSITLIFYGLKRDDINKIKF